MEPIWDGMIWTNRFNDEENRARQEFADGAKKYDWKYVFDILSYRHDLVNSTRPGGTSLFAPLHQAAHGGAPLEIIKKLIGLGAWRTLQNARGERPVDVAEKAGHTHLLAILTPQLKRRVPTGILLRIQSNFHVVIRQRAKEWVEQNGLRLPELEPLLEFQYYKIWFPILGMAGRVSFHLASDGIEAKLIAESWCRVVGGSGQRHEITSAGNKLVAEGFV